MYCDTMGGIPFCWSGCGCQSEDPFVLARYSPRDRKETREGRSHSGTEESREQSTEIGGSRRSEEKRLRRPVDPRGRFDQRESMSQHFWWLCRNFAWKHAHDSPQMHRKLPKSVTNFSLLAFGANPSPWLFFFSSTLSVVYVVFCVFIKKCEIAQAGLPWVV